jgi:hypothetical protein
MMEQKWLWNHDTTCCIKSPTTKYLPTFNLALQISTVTATAMPVHGIAIDPSMFDPIDEIDAPRLAPGRHRSVTILAMEEDYCFCGLFLPEIFKDLTLRTRCKNRNQNQKHLHLARFAEIFKDL